MNISIPRREWAGSDEDLRAPTGEIVFGDECIAFDFRAVRSASSIHINLRSKPHSHLGESLQSFEHPSCLRDMFGIQ
jgi:hypothetical protein